MTNDALLARIGESISAALPRLIEIRRDLHAHPELAREERRTTDVLAAHLAEAAIEHRRLPGTGLLADLGATDARYRVALRADIDALPVRERTALPWASTTPGVTHACGHDVHTTALLGAGLALKAHEAELIARGIGVRLVFQAAEETIPGGANDAIDHGALEGVDAAFAVHCDPSIDVGEIGLREGPLTAACDHIRVTLHGRGGHTSRPYRTEDLVYALGKVVTEVPAALARRVDPRAGATLVFGVIQAGKAANVIPSSGEAIGTLRVLDINVWQTAGELITGLVDEVVAPYGVQAKVHYTKGVPPVVNHPEAITAFRAATLAVGARPASTPQSLGGEDFSWYLEQVPGAMVRLGTRTPGGKTYDLHQGDLVIDEEALAIGARLLASVALTHDVTAALGAPASLRLEVSA